MTARMLSHAVRMPYASTPSPLPPTYTGVTDAAASGGAGTRPSVPGPRAVGTHATATHLAILTRGSTGASFERQQMQPYLRYGWPSTSTAARLDLRTASRAYPRINSDAAAQQHRPGFLWGPTACPTCVGGPSLDVWHAVAECPSLDGVRCEALAAAAAAATASAFGRTRALARVYADVAATLHTGSGRTFIFMATLGGAITRAAGALKCALPPLWVACLAVPRSQSAEQQVVSGPCVATTITFPAFARVVRAVARPIDEWGGPSDNDTA